MPTLLTRVRPGDMITADQWNLVVDAVNQLLQQTPATPGAGITFTASVPAGTTTEPFRVGAQLQIVGQNFGYTQGRTSVRFTSPAGSVELLAGDLQAGSSDTRLLLTVPGIPGVTTSNTSITLTIGNGSQSTALTRIALVPSNPLTGDIFVNKRNDVPNPNPISPSASGQVDFAFRLRAATNQRATFALSADIRNASTTIPAGLVASIQFLDETASVRLTSPSVDLQAGETRNLVVRIPVLPATWDRVTFSLLLTATSGALTNSDSQLITVGVATAQNDPAIDAQQTGVDFLNTATGDDVTNPANARFESGTIKMRAGHLGVISFNVRTTTAGTYDVTFVAKDPATANWTPQLVNSPAQIPGNAAQAQLIQIGVIAAANSSATGTVVFHIKRQGATVEWSKEFPVQLLT